MQSSGLQGDLFGDIWRQKHTWKIWRKNKADQESISTRHWRRGSQGAPPPQPWKKLTWPRKHSDLEFLLSDTANPFLLLKPLSLQHCLQRSWYQIACRIKRVSPLLALLGSLKKKCGSECGWGRYILLRYIKEKYFKSPELQWEEMAQRVKYLFVRQTLGPEFKSPSTYRNLGHCSRYLQSHWRGRRGR